MNIWQRIALLFVFCVMANKSTYPNDYGTLIESVILLAILLLALKSDAHSQRFWDKIFGWFKHKPKEQATTPSASTTPAIPIALAQPETKPQSPKLSTYDPGIHITAKRTGSGPGFMPNELLAKKMGKVMNLNPVGYTTRLSTFADNKGS